MSDWNTHAHSAMQIHDVQVAYPNGDCRVRSAIAAMVLEVLVSLTRGRVKR